MQVGIATQETGTKTVIHTQHILNHQHLAVHIATGTDAYNGYSPVSYTHLGPALASGVLEKPVMSTDLFIRNLGLNEGLLGDANIHGEWHHEIGRAHV